MIGLKAAPGHQCIGAFGQGFAEQEFQFAQFVATAAETGQVVALDVEVAAIEFGQAAQAGQFLDRGRAFEQGHPGVRGQRGIKMSQVVEHEGSLVEWKVLGGLERHPPL
ncbi:hypothetical protein D3C84_822450 [compost metagenome]